MKKGVTLIIASFIWLYTTAQSVSMFDGNPQWVYVHHYLLADAGYYEMGTNKTVYSFYKYYVEGADVINNKTYHRLYADYVDNLVIDIEDDQYKKLEPEFSDSSYTHKFVCHLREENGCVYGIKSEMDYLSVFNPYTITDGDEVVLYDFNNWHIGYEQPIYHNWTEKLGMTWKINDIAERVMMDNSVRTVLNINDIEHIEGVGPLEVSFVYNPISNPLTSGYTGDYYLNVFVQNDNIVYRAPLPDEATDKEGSQYGVYREDPFIKTSTENTTSMFDGNPQWTYVDGEIVVKTIFDENDYPVCEDTTVYVSFYRLYIDGTDKRYGNTYQRLCEDYIDGNLEDGDQSYKGKYILGVHHSELGSAIYANQEMFEECTGVNLNYLSPYPLLDCHDIELYSFLDVGEKYEYETQYSNNFADGEIPWFQIIDKGTETIGNESFDYTDVNCYDIEKYRVYNKLGALNRWWYNPLLVSFAYSPSYTDRHFMYLNTYSENGKVVYTAPEYTGDPEKKHLSKDTYREDPFLTEDNQSSGIEEITTNTTNCRTDNAIYDLMGRRLNGVPAKGIYIQNGKKYVR